MKRILLSLLLLWVAIAPAVASACAAGCESRHLEARSIHTSSHDMAHPTAHEPAPTHGVEHAGSNQHCPDALSASDTVPDGNSDDVDGMASACLLAAAALISNPANSAVVQPLAGEPASAPLQSSSHSPAPPIKPPQA